ncbi:MAG: branched-chain amino acid ABC transporter permease [Campylobacteraceae bacterium]
METFLQQLINGLTIGSLFALVALGYTMVYGVMRLINFAHGDLVVLAAFTGLTLYNYFFADSGTSVFIVLTIFCLSAILMAVVGVALEFFAYRPLRNAPRLSAVVSALGAGMIIQNAIMLTWGPNMQIFPTEFLPNTIWNVGGVVVTFTQAAILGISAIIMVALFVFINRTKVGIAIRAVAIDQDAARLMGINVNVIIMLIFIIGSMLGAVAGIFIGANYTSVTFSMGWNYGLSAFIAAIIGGIGNIPGAVLGGLLLGLFNAMISGYVSTQWAETFTYILLIVILIFRPNGILGETIAEKV